VDHHHYKIVRFSEKPPLPTFGDDASVPSCLTSVVLAPVRLACSLLGVDPATFPLVQALRDAPLMRTLLRRLVRLRSFFVRVSRRALKGFAIGASIKAVFTLLPIVIRNIAHPAKILRKLTPARLLAIARYGCFLGWFLSAFEGGMLLTRPTHAAQRRRDGAAPEDDGGLLGLPELPRSVRAAVSGLASGLSIFLIPADERTGVAVFLTVRAAECLCRCLYHDHYLPWTRGDVDLLPPEPEPEPAAPDDHAPVHRQRHAHANSNPAPAPAAPSLPRRLLAPLAAVPRLLLSVPPAHLIFGAATAQLIYAWMFAPAAIDPAYNRFLNAHTSSIPGYVLPVASLHTGMQHLPQTPNLGARGGWQRARGWQDVDVAASLAGGSASVSSPLLAVPLLQQALRWRGLLRHPPLPAAALPDRAALICAMMHPQHAQCLPGHALSAVDIMRAALKTYLPVYLIPGILFRRKALADAPAAWLRAVATNTVRSAAFFTALVFGAFVFSCGFRSGIAGSAWVRRHASSLDILTKPFAAAAAAAPGRPLLTRVADGLLAAAFHPTVIPLSAGLGAALSLFIEKPGRRLELALYLASQAAKTVLTLAHLSGRLPAPHTLAPALFAGATCAVLALYVTQPMHLRPAYFSLVSFLLGSGKRHLWLPRDRRDVDRADGWLRSANDQDGEDNGAESEGSRESSFKCETEGHGSQSHSRRSSCGGMARTGSGLTSPQSMLQLDAKFNALRPPLPSNSPHTSPMLQNNSLAQRLSPPGLPESGYQRPLPGDSEAK
jgi:hypothetical protein